MIISDADPSPSGSARSTNPPAPASVRRNSSSSCGSDAYSPLPPGLWTLSLHGNCSRCHHHHSSARFKVNVPSNPNITTHIRCESCHAKWLAIGGRNVAQLSLLSVNSVRPDPEATDVRYSLVNMVRTTTALAALSPVMAEITESLPPGSSRHQSLCTPLAADIESDVPHISQPVDPMRLVRVRHTSTQALQKPASFPTLTSVQPNSTQKYGIVTGRHFAHLKERLGMRFPALHRANLRVKLGIIKQPKVSAKRLGKQPTRVTVYSEPTMDSVHTPDASRLKGHYGEGHQYRPISRRLDSAGRPATPSDAVVQFLATVANDITNLSAMTEDEKIVWIREKYTEFRNRPAVQVNAPAMASMETATIPDAATEALYNEANLHRGRSLELLGLGSHHGQFDRFWPVRPSTISVCERTSEAETAVDETTNIASGPRYSWIEHLRRERSGSPRPPSVNTHTAHRIRGSRGEIRFSMDSAVTGEATRSTSRPRSSATDRRSQGSTARTSMLGTTVSQTSLASH